MGECYRILNDPKAVTAYASAIKYKYPDSTVYLHHGEVLMYQGKYKEAEKAFQTYLEWQPDSYQAQAGVYACQQVGEWKKVPSRYKIQLSKELNAKRSSNFAPCFVGDNDDALMFTSNRQERTKAKQKKTQRGSPVTGQQLFQLYSARKNASGNSNGTFSVSLCISDDKICNSILYYYSLQNLAAWWPLMSTW